MRLWDIRIQQSTVPYSFKSNDKALLQAPNGHFAVAFDPSGLAFGTIGSGNVVQLFNLKALKEVLF